jgi:MFS family permease
VIAALGMVSSFSTIAGPIISGLLIHADILGSSWRPAFLINLPIGLIGLALAARYLPESRSQEARRLDLPGVGIVSAALVALVFPLIQGHEQGWPWWMFVMLAGSAPLFALFLLRSNRVRSEVAPATVRVAPQKKSEVNDHETTRHRFHRTHREARPGAGP